MYSFFFNPDIPVYLSAKVHTFSKMHNFALFDDRKTLAKN